MAEIRIRNLLEESHKMRLSVITINRNNAEGLRKTMESVFAQTYRDFEYIVVDGASSDGSVNVIKENAQKVEKGLCQLAKFKWVSEPDTGIYNAMNKGIEIAEGRRVVNSFNRSEFVEDKNKGSEDGYVLMLNSGDYFVDEHVVERVLPELDGIDIVQGNVIEKFPEKSIRFRGYGYSNISFIDALEANFPHQAMFIKLTTMGQYGYYDDTYKKSSDTYFFIMALAFGNATFRYVDIDIANFDPNGISSKNDPIWIKIEKEEDARWFGEHVSNRLYEHCKKASHAIVVYEILYQNKWIGWIVDALLKISRRLKPLKPKVKKEIVDETRVNYI